MSEQVVFWYGCNVLRHGDIIHSAIEVLRAAGIEPTPVGGPGYCCGSPKDANLRAAEGMAVRTVEKFNAMPQQQLVTYFFVVLVFVTVVMALVSVLDLAFGKLVFELFTGSNTQ